MKKHILVIDDSKFINKALSKRLSKKYEVSSCFNGIEALIWLKKNTADLILLDLQMPEMTGLEFLPIFRTSYSKSTPIIVLTSEPQEEVIDICLSSGANDFLPKPTIFADIEASMTSLLAA